MLLKLFVLLFSNYPVLSQYEFDSGIPILLQPQIEERNENAFNDSENLTASCPANEALIQIQNILTKLLGIEEDNNNHNLKVMDTQQGNGLFGKESQFNLENEIEKVLPLSKGNSLRQLLEKNEYNSNYKTKITVQYEIPNEPDQNCKTALTNILQVLKNANLMHDAFRSCGPYDTNCPKKNVLDMKNIGNQNVFTTNVNQGNNYLPNMNNQKPIDSNSLLGSGLDMKSVLKYLALQRNPDFKSIFDNYRSKEQVNDIKILNEMPNSINEFTQALNTDGKELIQNEQTNYSDKTPYLLHITEKIIPQTNLNEIKQKLNISEYYAENIKQDTPFVKQKPSNVDEKPDDVLVTVTNDGKIVSVYPTTLNNDLFGPEQNNLVTDTFLPDYAKLQNKESVASHVKNLLNQYLQGHVSNLPKDRMNALLAVLKTDGSDAQYQRFPHEILNGNENLEPFYVNQNLISNINQYPLTNPGLSSSVRQYPYKEGSNDQLHANLNVFNRITNQENLLNLLYPPHVTGNPYVNSKLVDYGEHVNELHAPSNFDNLQRLVTETNLGKLHSSPDNSGVVELTYLLKRPHPVVYQPVYYVKYRLPYDSFVNNLRDLVRRQPQLRSNRAKLYQEILALSTVAEVSPNLKGLGQQQLLQMVANNGALVKTKVLKVNDTLLEQLKTLTPPEVGFGTYKGEPNIVNKNGLLNKTIEIGLNKTQIEELENFEKEKQTSTNLSEINFSNFYKTAANKYGKSTDKNPSNTMYPLV